jgi:2-hydroxy-3-keto-5-methylthiopentenyl-1-phosphate phosphatase
MAAKKFILSDFLGTVSISDEHSWVVKKMLHRISDEEKTDKEWRKAIKDVCGEGIKIN